MALVLLGANNRRKGLRVALLLKSVDRRWHLLVDRHTRGRTLGLLLNARIDGLHLGGVFRVLRGWRDENHLRTRGHGNSRNGGAWDRHRRARSRTYRGRVA